MDSAQQSGVATATLEASTHDNIEKQPYSTHDESQEDQKVAAAVEIDAVQMKRIRRKIDIRLMPILVVLYMLAFLDRVNVGAARLWHLEEDLGMEGNDFNIAVIS